MNANLQAAVLVGGRARRFGRDKLLEPWRGTMGGEVLVDQPILSLRKALGGAVWAVGECDPGVSARADRRVPDDRPGNGPLGGIVAALRAAGRDVFVMPGDLPAITDAVVSRVARAALETNASAVLARGGREEPCVGVYRPSALGVLSARLERGELALRAAAAELGAVWVDVPAELMVNANEPRDLDALKDLTRRVG